jgi:hypothetical protein
VGPRVRRGHDYRAARESAFLEHRHEAVGDSTRLTVRGREEHGNVACSTSRLDAVGRPLHAPSMDRGGFNDPDFDDTSHDEDDPDKSEEQAITPAFDCAKPTESDPDGDAQQTFCPRLENAYQRHDAVSQRQEVCPRPQQTGGEFRAAMGSSALNLQRHPRKISHSARRTLASRTHVGLVARHIRCSGVHGNPERSCIMRTSHRWQSVLVGLLMTAGTASAQGTPPPQAATVPPGNMWSHGTMLNAFAGAAATSGDRAALAGGAFGWEVKPWLAFEGSGRWLDWGQGVHAFAPSLTTQVALLTSRPWIPFVAGGVGLYHASFNRADNAMPGFYRRRMMGTSNLGTTITFDDPSVIGGGGLHVFVSRHWTVGPEVLATVVLRDGRHFVVTTGAVRLAYHFEDHPVTPLMK